VAKVPGFGNPTADVMVVGEAPGAAEDRQGRPFVGGSGAELRRMLSEAGIVFEDCWTTNVVRFRPENNDITRFFYKRVEAKKIGRRERDGRFPRDIVFDGITELEREISLVAPRLILALGETALWALTGLSGITKWRGSQLHYKGGEDYPIPLVPTYHPAAILRQWAWRATAVQDFRRAREWMEGGRQPPEQELLVAPTFHTTLLTLQELSAHLRTDHPLTLSVDIETRAGFMSCVGLGWNHFGKPTALCIPWMTIEQPDGYFSPIEEQTLRTTLKRILLHPLTSVVMQNGLYDTQYFIREDGYAPLPRHDTMLLQHALFPGTPKSLDYLASIYCDHYVYWKEESHEWDYKLGERQYWLYNCKDVLTTLEIHHRQIAVLEQQGLRPVYNHLMRLYAPVLAAMTQGIRWDQGGAETLGSHLAAEMAVDRARLHKLFGHDVNPRSPHQLRKLFYEDFRLPPIIHPKTKRPTLDEAALVELRKTHPIFHRPITLILNFRQKGVLLSTYVNHHRAPDCRYHTSFNIGGTETFRFSSSANVYGEGTNGQNIPPEIKILLKPDKDHTVMDWDLDRADAQVVGAEAEDAALLSAFRRGENIHVKNAKDLFPATRGWSDEAIVASQDVEDQYKRYYYLAKTGVHATNYLVQPRTLARTLGITVREAELFRKRWFGLHPGIQRWHTRIELQLKHQSFVTNAFGFRRFYFERIDLPLVQAALAWIPQSTVAIVIAKGMAEVYERLAEEVDILLQVHDSLVLQTKTDRVRRLAPIIRDCLLVEVPYRDPLIIPVGVKTSEVSWGACKEYTI
jgi:DNA polymerase I-like protein with 3'-5' exonuclease and polymerase domains/uracil-DNA glycosylase